MIFRRLSQQALRRRTLIISGLLTLTQACAATGEDAVGSSQHAVTAQPDASCRPAAHGGREYWFCQSDLSWDEAQANCETVGMNLARVDDAEENAFIEEEAAYRVWVGGTDRDQEGDWRWNDNNLQFWADGRSGSPVDGAFSQWGWFEPGNNSGRNCLYVDSYGNWADDDCDDSNQYVCESTPDADGFPQAPDEACTRAERDGHAYWFCSSEREFDDARARCQSLGMDLANVEDEDEDAFIHDNVAVDSRIGLTDSQTEGAWRWTHGHALAHCSDASEDDPQPGYSNWQAGQPQRSNTCARFVSEDSEYWLCVNPRKWADAATQCAQSGMHLAQIDSAEEQAFLASVTYSYAWIGANDRNDEGQWTWADGTPFWSGSSSGGPVDGAYAQWQFFEPNNFLGEDCAAISAPGPWVDLNCNLLSLPFICETDSNDGPPDVNDCAHVRSSSGGEWGVSGCDTPKGYVCEDTDSLPAASLNDLTDRVIDDFRQGPRRVGSAMLKPGSGLAEPFITHGDEFGLRACTDRLVPIGEPTHVAGVGDAQGYRQTYRGVPVHGRGYVVYRDPGSTDATRIVGHIEHGIDLDITPTVGESTARSTAISAIGESVSDYPSTPQGELVLLPRQMGHDPQYELSWLFHIPSDSIDGLRTVGISAVNGDVLLLGNDLYHDCDTEMHPATPSSRATLTVDSRESRWFMEPAEAEVRALDDNASRDLLLYSNYRPAASNGTRVRIYGRCGADAADVAGYPAGNVAAINAPGGPDAFALSLSETLDGDDPRLTENELLAASYLALQTCFEYLAAKHTDADGEPWVGADGDGSPISVALVKSGTTIGIPRVAYSGTHSGIFVNTTEDSVRGAWLEAMCHELGHAVMDEFAGEGRPPQDLESRTVNESFGDVMGSAAELFAGRDADGVWCVGDHLYDPMAATQHCERNHADPWTSDSAMNDAVGPGKPRRIDDRFFCKPATMCRPMAEELREPGVNCCNEHQNLTIVTHWLYLLTEGGSSTAEDACEFTVGQLQEGDFEGSFDVATQILFAAFRDFYAQPGGAGGFRGLADATLNVAALDYPWAIQALYDAWFAVGVMADPLLVPPPGEDNGLRPERGADGVSPWVQFRWPAADDSGTWDLQVGYKPDFAPGQIAYQVDSISTFAEVGGRTFGEHRVALPNLAFSYYWRARLHSDAEWSDCQAIHAFETGELDAIERVEFFNRVDDEGRPRAGTGSYRWDTIDGALGYRVAVTESDECPVDEGDFDAYVAHNPDEIEDGMLSRTVDDLAPGRDYWVHLVAVGPTDTSDMTALAPCRTEAFSTTALAAPVILGPVHGSIRNYTFSQVQNWAMESNDDPDAFRIQIFEAPGTGSCSSDVPPTVDSELSSFVCSIYTTGGDCPATATTNFDLPSDHGYCYRMQAINDGNASPWSELAHFRYTLQGPYLQAPGMGEYGYLHWKQTDVRTSGDILGIPGHQAGDDVTFRWNWSSTVPGITPHGFGLKVMRWPLDHESTKDPAHCSTGCFHDSFCSAPPVCELGSDEVVWDSRTAIAAGFVTGSQVTLPGARVGQGRFCYQAWPIATDPANPGNPSFDIYTTPSQPFCYTTDPSEPRIIFDNPPAAGESYSGDTVTGRIEMDYVPDGQFIFRWSHGDDFTFVTTDDGRYCALQPNAITFSDVYSCAVEFEVDPTYAGQDYSLEVSVYNSEGKAQPVLDDSTLVHTVQETFSSGTCGSEGDVCCTDTDPDTSGCYWEDGEHPMICGESNTCEQCGRVGQVCCAGGDVTGWCGWPHDRPMVCDDADRCRDCGGANELCCDTDTGNGCFKAGEALSCEGDSCRRCGGDDQICCDNGTYDHSGQGDSRCLYNDRLCQDDVCKWNCSGSYGLCDGPINGCDPGERDLERHCACNPTSLLCSGTGGGTPPTLEILDIRTDDDYPYVDVLVTIRNNGGERTPAYIIYYQFSDLPGYLHSPGAANGPILDAGETGIWRYSGTLDGCHTAEVRVPGDVWDDLCN